MNSQELKKNFIDFFSSKNHKMVKPAGLIPENDPSVLFTTAGMQQFKRFYTHPEEAPAKNVVTIQPCLRTSDIDEVGDETHLTFFEMLGNFSFGGYFSAQGRSASGGKKEAVEMALEFLTKELKIEPKRISCSIFAGDNQSPRDTESAEILAEMKLPFKEFDREENFWGPTGDEGPCGPTVELYIDDIEVWNLVFNEYYFKDGKYEPLSTPGVDTGMGLERMLVVLNGLTNVYETDVLEYWINKIQEATHEDYADKNIKAMRRIADHSRAVVNLIKNGIRPGKTERESVLRILLRVIFIEINYIMPVTERKKSFVDPWDRVGFLLHSMFHDWSSYIGNIYIDQDKTVQKIILDEYQSYLSLEKLGVPYIRQYKDASIITGEIIFRGKDTFGFTPEGVVELWETFDKPIDPKWKKQFEEAFKKHQEISRAGVSGFKGGLVGESEITTRMHTATHLLLRALQEVLGPNVHQRGSNINEERIRFDFSYPKPMTNEEIKKVEKIVNEKITEDLPVIKKETTIEEAKKIGAEAQFVNKYGDKVTLYSIGNYSHELCGGPHVKSTGEIGKFKITKEESSSAGVRRIRAKLE